MHMQTEGYIPKCSQNVGSVHAKKLTKADKKSASLLIHNHETPCRTTTYQLSMIFAINIYFKAARALGLSIESYPSNAS